MTKLNKLSKVDDSLTVHMYDNGFMVEVSGRDSEDDWATAKIVCNSMDEVVQILNEVQSMGRS
jgi:hypothetical protein